MPKNYPVLFSAGQIGSLEVPNRVVMAPMATSFASANGEVTEWMINYYAERAKGGAGLIIVENANVDYPSGISGTTQLRVDKDRYVPALSRLAQAIHSQGALCALQLNHAGAVAHKAIEEGVQPIAPSEGPKGLYKQLPKVLTVSEINKICSRFANAAQRAQKAGFDAVEIHGAHAYLVAQFLSPLTNGRHDNYGGNTENRTRFAREILAELRKVLSSQFPIIFRLDVCEFLEGGIEVEESASIAQLLTNEGVDAFDLTVGTHYRLSRSLCAQLEPMSYELGWRLDLVAKVKKHLNMPVIAVGPFREPESAEKAIVMGQTDFVALGRPFIADPHWAKKSLMGREEEIRRCISCNEGCVRTRLFEDRPVSCTVNPEVGWERSNLIKPANQTKRLIVVGGGPAGCTAAIYAKQLGHEVVLLEQNLKLGGNCLLGSRLPKKEKLAWVVDYQRERLDSLGVDVRLANPFSIESLIQTKPDFLVLAIGGEPYIPQDIITRDLMPIHAEDVIRQGITWSKAHVAVIGAGALGCETALALAQADNEVTVMEAMTKAARELEPISRFDLLERLAGEHRVNLLTKTRVLQVESTKIYYDAIDSGSRTLSVDQIVWATGYRSRNLKGLPSDLFPKSKIMRIGDCLKPRNVYHAVKDGFWLGSKILS